MDMIKGAKEFYGTPPARSPPSGVAALDDYTVQITLEAPFGSFLANIATHGCSIYDERPPEAAGDQFGVDPSKCFGTGPFQVSSGSARVGGADRQPQLLQGAPKIDGIPSSSSPKRTRSA